MESALVSPRRPRRPGSSLDGQAGRGQTVEERLDDDGCALGDDSDRRETHDGPEQSRMERS